MCKISLNSTLVHDSLKKCIKLPSLFYLLQKIIKLKLEKLTFQCVTFIFIKMNVKFEKILIRGMRLEGSFGKFYVDFLLYRVLQIQTSKLRRLTEKNSPLESCTVLEKENREKRNKKRFPFFCSFILHTYSCFYLPHHPFYQLTASSIVICLMSTLFRMLLAFCNSALDRTLTTLIAAKHCSALIFHKPNYRLVSQLLGGVD